MLQLAAWSGSGVIHTHHDYMVGLRSQLNGTRIKPSDQVFYSYFTESLPPSLDLFIAQYEDNTHDSSVISSRSTRCARSQVQEGRGFVGQYRRAVRSAVGR